MRGLWKTRSAITRTSSFGSAVITMVGIRRKSGSVRRCVIRSNPADARQHQIDHDQIRSNSTVEQVERLLAVVRGQHRKAFLREDLIQARASIGVVFND